MKQETLATELGISQQAISKLEQSEEIGDSILIASSLNYQPTLNTIEKIVELYERLLDSEWEKVGILSAK